MTPIIISSLLAQACHEMPLKTTRGVRDSLTDFFSACGRGTRYGASSFKTRWGVAPGLLRAGEDVEPTQCEAKDAKQCFSSFLRAEPFPCGKKSIRGYRFGCHIWSPKLGPSLLKLLGKGHFYVPDLALKLGRQNLAYFCMWVKLSQGQSMLAAGYISKVWHYEDPSVHQHG